MSRAGTMADADGESVPAKPRSRFIRFLMSGAFNTLATYAVYVLLLPVLSYRWSYTVAYLCGVGLGYVLYRFYVFERRGRRWAPLWVCAAYGVQYLLGLLLTSVWVALIGGDPLLAPAFAVAISVPVMYLLNRWIFSDRP